MREESFVPGGKGIMLKTFGIERINWNKDLYYLCDEELVFKKPKVDSEHSEENIIQSVFDHIPPMNKWCVDVGAFGIGGSNTYKLIKEGWKSIQIEPNVDQFLTLEKIYQDNFNVTVINNFITPGKLLVKNEPNCLDSVLSVHAVPSDFDFLSIDIDGYDYEVWMNLDLYSPNLICIECNQFETDFSVIDYDPSFGSKGIASLSKYKNQRDGYGGATVGLLNKLAEKKGYTYLCLDINNVFYIKDSFLKV